jgi:GNAT superfamily N-acetyltransferase
MTDVEVRVTSYSDDVVRALEERVQAEYVHRYGGPDVTETAAAQFDPPEGMFLVLWADGEAVACGGFRHHDERTVELKRMYVVPEARRRGYSRLVLAALEERARDAGYTRVLLETGTAQPEAISLYGSSGYERVEGFGHYRDSPLSRSFGKDL